MRGRSSQMETGFDIVTRRAFEDAAICAFYVSCVWKGQTGVEVGGEGRIQTKSPPPPIKDQRREERGGGGGEERKGRPREGENSWELSNIS